jgi:hypothetical protein
MFVPVPTPPVVSLEEPPNTDLDPLDSGEAIAILAADEKDSLFVTNCVQEQLAEMLPDNRVMTTEEVRDLLFPWLEPGKVPKDDAAAQAFIARPATAAKVRELRLRYLIEIALVSTGTGIGAGFDLGGFGAGTKSARVSAQVVDLEAGCCRAGGSARATGIVGGAILVWGIWIFPIVEGPACERLSAALVQKLTPRMPSAP